MTGVNGRGTVSRKWAKNGWDKLADEYDQRRISNQIYLACIDQVVAPFRRGRMRLCLDAGCGTGLSTTALLARADVIVGVDSSFRSLQILKQKEVGERILLVQAELTRLPFRQGVFDGTVCANTVQHLRPDGEQLRAINELRRATRRERLIVVSAHHYSRDKRKRGWVKEGVPGQQGVEYIYRFSRAELLSLLPGATIRAAGFSSKVRFAGASRWAQYLASKVFGRVAARIGLGHMLIAIAENGPGDQLT